jgi:hypothetical protein
MLLLVILRAAVLIKGTSGRTAGMRIRRTGTTLICLRGEGREIGRREFSTRSKKEQKNLSLRCEGSNSSGQQPQEPDYRGGAQRRRHTE